jgi:hypothetical protein
MGANNPRKQSDDGSGAGIDPRRQGDEAMATIIKPSEVPKYVPGA